MYRRSTRKDGGNLSFRMTSLVQCTSYTAIFDRKIMPAMMVFLQKLERLRGRRSSSVSDIF